MHLVKVKFETDYQGHLTPGHFYHKGQVAEVELSAAIALRKEEWATWAPNENPSGLRQAQAPTVKPTVQRGRPKK
jgi:hypothetical protein